MGLSLVQLLGDDARARITVDVLASRPRRALYDYGGEVEASIESSGASRRVHAGYELGDALDVAGRVFPHRRTVDRAREVLFDGRDRASLTAMVGVVFDEPRPRAKLYVARGDGATEESMRALATALAKRLGVDVPLLVPSGRCDVVAIEAEPGGRESLKVYLTFESPQSVPEALVASAADRARIAALYDAARGVGRCPLMITTKAGRAAAAQVALSPDALAQFPWAPRPPPGVRPTYVSFQLGDDGPLRATTYYLVSGQPLAPRSIARADAPPVAPPKPEPKAIDISIGEHCNNNCTFCINPTESWAPLAPAAQLRETISACAAKGYERMSFLGGEPTLHPELPELIEHAYRSGFAEVLLITNGRRFADPVFAARIREAGTRRALFMFVSHRAEVHDAVTRRAGSHAEAVAGIACAQAAGIEVAVNVPVSAANVDHLAEAGEWFADRGVKAIAYLYLAAYGNVLSTPGVMADYARAARALAKACDVLGERMVVNIDNFPFCYLPGHERFILGEMANPWREIAYPTGGIVDVASYFRFRKVRLPQCDGCEWDRSCGGIQPLEEVEATAREMNLARIRRKESVEPRT